MKALNFVVLARFLVVLVLVVGALCVYGVTSYVEAKSGYYDGKVLAFVQSVLDGFSGPIGLSVVAFLALFRDPKVRSAAADELPVALLAIALAAVFDALSFYGALAAKDGSTNLAGQYGSLPAVVSTALTAVLALLAGKAEAGARSEQAAASG
jgi:hypothetical protein